MAPYQQEFIQFALQHGVLRFGEFVLKSGRKSPYFFNSGLFASGASLSRLGRFYAAAITASGLDFDMLYGPAYKGIPLVAAVAMALNDEHGRDLPYCFNRKEAKDHGEGGIFVGYYIAYVVFLVLDATQHEALPIFSGIMLLFVLPLTVLTFSVVLLRSREAIQRAAEADSDGR